MNDYQPSNYNNQSQPSQNQSDKVTITNFYKKSSHPKITIILVSLKICTFLVFLLLSLFVGNEAIVMLVSILFGVSDFWFTKNIAGRMLVGLRWWNQYKPQTNEEVWIFEGKNEKKEGADGYIFWICIYVSTAVWVFFFIWELIRLKFIWAVLACVLLVLTGINTYGFIRCSKRQDQIIKNTAGNMLNKMGKK